MTLPSALSDMLMLQASRVLSASSILVLSCEHTRRQRRIRRGKGATTARGTRDAPGVRCQPGQPGEVCPAGFAACRQRKMPPHHLGQRKLRPPPSPRTRRGFENSGCSAHGLARRRGWVRKTTTCAPGARSGEHSQDTARRDAPSSSKCWMSLSELTTMLRSPCEVITASAGVCS